jgi:hypothetical protein
MFRIIKIIILIVGIVTIWHFIQTKRGNIVAPEPVPVVEQRTSEQEKVLVEKYIRENIKNLATENPVLGGSWYLLSAEIDTNTKTGLMSYEDGHIQGNASFSYEINGDIVKLNNIIKK